MTRPKLVTDGTQDCFPLRPQGSINERLQGATKAHIQDHVLQPDGSPANSAPLDPDRIWALRLLLTTTLHSKSLFTTNVYLSTS